MDGEEIVKTEKGVVISIKKEPEEENDIKVSYLIKSLLIA